jgi:nucleotide-binding universal stress UspA family protein
MDDMASFTSILCAVDATGEAPRVLRLGAAVAALSGAHLTVLTVTDGDRRGSEGRLESLVANTLPPGIPSLSEPRLRVARHTQGGVADAILEFAREGIDLVVAGTHARSGLSRWLLGSTSAALLEQTTCPTLLVPPSDGEVATVTAEGVRLNFGAVVAAVDLAEHNDRQLHLAREMATLAGQPLVLMTVASPEMTDRQAEEALAGRARALELGAVRHLVVRRGAVAEEIARAAALEPAHLVVMGLRERGHGVAGEIATKVVHGKDTVVLAVPAA